AESPEIIYATRAYLTRHGAGPFPTELAEKPYPRIEDLTNIPNPYQGTLRFGLLDLDSLSKEISNDLKNSGALNYSASLAVTCLDQIDDKIEYILNSVRIKSGVEDFLRAALRTVKVEKCYTSYGPTRSTIFPVTNI
ncbi:MAG: adenylosuccinate synthetase, partial [Bacillota bacterium]|nr:adenylosuccinate synthetase [Bacillota bacterium]